MNPIEAKEQIERNMDNPLVAALSLLEAQADTPEKKAYFEQFLTKLAYTAAEKMRDGYAKEFRLLLCDAMSLTDNLHTFLTDDAVLGVSRGDDVRPFTEEQITGVRVLLQNTNRLIAQMLEQANGEGHTEGCDHE